MKITLREKVRGSMSKGSSIDKAMVIARKISRGVGACADTIVVIDGLI